MPDAELLAHAAAGDLHQPDVLTAQARRMLRDPQVRGLATEFGGNWLDFRRFEEHNSVDRERFPSFTNELRQAMFEEPIRYFIDVAQRNRSVLDLLYGNDTFVNRPLARHYGMPEPPKGADEWVHVEDARPLRPRRPAADGGLSHEERAGPAHQSRQARLLGRAPAAGRTDSAAAADRPRVAEGRGEAGRADAAATSRPAPRRQELRRLPSPLRFGRPGLRGLRPDRRTPHEGPGRPPGRRPLRPSPTARTATGSTGLREYLRDKRQDDFVDNLCRKLFSYALGRSLLLSDKKTLDAMRTRLAADEYAFGSLVEAIVTSPQFLNKRGRDDPAWER